MKKLLLFTFFLTLGTRVSFAVDFTITVSTTTATRIGSAYTFTYGYQSTLPDGTPNPETKAQFTLRMIKAQIQKTVIDFESFAAGQAAQRAQEDQVKQQVIFQ